MCYSRPVMRRYFSTFLLVLTSIALAGFVVGCKKDGGQAAANVDIQAQLDTLKSTDKDTRLNGLVSLATLKQGAAPAVPQLIEQLKDSDPDIRRLAAYALMEIGRQAKAALPQLNTMMQDPDRGVVTQVISSIRTIDPGALKDLDLQKVKDAL
jgi:HEAT repeat protein